jgi:hypothetical protein
MDFIKINKKIILLTLMLLPVLTLADIYSSGSYQMLDPVIDLGGGFSTSSSYSLTQSLGQYMLGTTTAVSFGMQSGFLAYPVCSSPVLSATPGAGQVSLSWTLSQAFVGWTISGYDVGVSVVSGGPYTYEDVGNTNNFTKTGLTAGTTYYFRVRAKDAFSNEICLSAEASAAPTSAAPTPTPSAGPAAGGRIIGPPAVQAVFKGYAYPNADMRLLKDGRLLITAKADSLGNFDIKAGSFQNGDYLFMLYALDNAGRMSKSLSMFVKIRNEEVVEFDDIVIPPTLSSDKQAVERGQRMPFFGQSYPGAKVFLYMEDAGFFSEITADIDGNYFFNIDTSGFGLGEHFAKANSVVNDITSRFSWEINFDISKETGEISTPQPTRPPSTCPFRGDYNKDCRVNFVDFSIMMYWFNSRGVADGVDENKDGVVNVKDFSIMAYYWTG